jgi:hypothetical protein
VLRRRADIDSARVYVALRDLIVPVVYVTIRAKGTVSASRYISAI